MCWTFKLRAIGNFFLKLFAMICIINVFMFSLFTYLLSNYARIYFVKCFNPLFHRQWKKLLSMVHHEQYIHFCSGGIPPWRAWQDNFTNCFTSSPYLSSPPLAPHQQWFIKDQGKRIKDQGSRIIIFGWRIVNFC